MHQSNLNLKRRHLLILWFHLSHSDEEVDNFDDYNQVNFSFKRFYFVHFIIFLHYSDGEDLIKSTIIIKSEVQRTLHTWSFTIKCKSGLTYLSKEPPNIMLENIPKTIHKTIPIPRFRKNQVRYDGIVIEF